MLQGTYVQEDAKDFEPPADEIAAFEERLQHGSSGAAMQISGQQRRTSAPLAEPHRPAHHAPPSTGHTAAPGSSPAAQRDPGQRRMSEAEQEEAIQLKEDVDEVRHLDARFGGKDDDSD